MWSVRGAKCWHQPCWLWALLAPQLVPLGMGGLIPKKKRRVCGSESSRGAQVRVGPTPVVLWKKKYSRYNREVEKLKMEAPSRAGLKEVMQALSCPT